MISYIVLNVEHVYWLLGVESQIMIERVTLAKIGSVITAPGNLVYSTSPRSVTSCDGVNYVRKGPELNVVVTELIAHLLSEKIGIKTPEFAYCKDENCFHFLSRKVVDCVRNIQPWLKQNQPEVIRQVCQIIVFDIWIMNYDRNIGNLLGVRSDNDASISVIAIDFEKSAALRGQHPLTESSERSPGSFWPTGDLGRAMRGTQIPVDLMNKIQDISPDVVAESVTSVSDTIGNSFTWAGSSIQLLQSRQNRLPELAREVWQ